ncbi:MAG: nucleotidyltransferase domain-containing protein [Thermaerobacter sp.]|jgi:predicted nucleotidyltransferase|nr:nucleotidyltransferase domain-containing protein [Thermaerobacter sp.]
MSRALVRVDLERVAARVTQVLPRFAEVAGAYLFGSGIGLCRPDSDLDLALILRRPAAHPLQLEGRVEAQLGSVDGHPFSVLALGHPGRLAWEVIGNGRLMYEQDRDAVTDFLEQTALLHDRERQFLATFWNTRREDLQI